MSRLKTTLAVFLVVSAALLLILLAQARAAVDAETRARRAVIAERIFDEMERALTGVLERDDLRARAGTRSTRERTAAGYFEVYPDGRVFSSTPMAAEPARRAFADGYPAPPPRPPPRSAREEPSGALLPQPAASRTEWLGATPPSPVETSAAFWPLVALNRGALRGRVAGYELEAYEARRAGSYLLVFRALGREVRHDGMRSEHRSTREWREHREGIALELDALDSWLAAQTLGDARFATLALEWADAPSARRRDAYRRRFAHPFDALAATVVIAPLDDAPTAITIYVLALLAWLAMAAALALAYRVSATRLRIAQQQSQFVSAVTHELRTPLTTLRMYSEMLRDGLVPADAQRDYHDAMALEAERLSRLVENVLSHAKLGRGDRALALRSVSLRATLAPTLRLLTSHARAHGLELRAELPDAPPAVLADPDALLQVVVNLVDNAVVHAPEAEPRRVELTAEARGAHVELRVRDHGPGVPAPRLEAIFAPFVSDTEGRGVGLGLALVRALVEEMGGEVLARNAPDGGLEVIARLRRA